MHSRRRQVRETSRIHNCKKGKTPLLIVTYFFFGPATLANLEFRLLATEFPPLWEGTVPRNG